MGRNFTAVDGDAGDSYTCILSQDHRIKCFGYGLYGQLGYNGLIDLWDMGDNQEAVDLGNFVPIQVAVGGSHSCALSNHSSIKCWGMM